MRKNVLIISSSPRKMAAIPKHWQHLLQKAHRMPETM